jgi:energy-coupling factor transporter ATP-binding protein EcfA2
VALRDQVLVALTFGLAFLASTVPFLAFSALGAALLGPFLFLVEGVFYKGVLFLVLGSLFAVLPRPGVYLLFYALWMAAQALLSGWYAHGPVTLLFAGVAVTCMEVALWLGGITRRGGARRAAVLWPALAIGLGEAAIVYWDLLLLRALYRQYYAQWYLLLEAGSAGLYAALGAGAGLRMGRLLREMRRPSPEIPSVPAPDGPPAPVAGAPLLEVVGVTYACPGTEHPILRNLSLALQPGEIVLLGGGTGSGKTTLLRLIQGLLPPQQGTIRLLGHPRSAYNARMWAERCALLFQEPGLQILQPTVAEEVALGLRLAERCAAAPAVRAALAEQGLVELAPRPTHRLSGGEAQRVVLTALLAGSPRLLLLDEPLAHLDAGARAALAERLAALAAAGMAVLAAEHRLDALLPIAHRVLWLEQGAIAFAGPPAAFRAWQAARRPAISAPLARTGEALPAGHAAGSGLHLHGLAFRHPGAEAPVLWGVTTVLAPGEAVALTGANGSGKSTLLQLALGLRKPQAGEVALDGAPVRKLGWRRRAQWFGYLPQPADLLLHAPTALAELAAALRWRGWPVAAAEARAQAWLARLNLAHAAHRFPHLLSRGERQRLALGAVLIAAPRVLLLDEPFTGQDAANATLMLALCREFLAQDPARCLLVASHDLDMWEGAFSRRWRLEHGRLTEEPVPAATGRVLTLAAGGA